MRTIRRLYLYSVVFVSLETVLWGLINLLRSALETSRVGGGGDQLAQALAFLIVGIPVFLLHWWLVQRNIGQQPEERSAGLRAFFLYGLALALFIPVVQNLLAVLDRLLLLAAAAPASSALVGGYQSWIDNLVAILMNGMLGLYFLSVIRKDWLAGESQPEMEMDDLALARRVHRYAWVVYGLGLIGIGVQQVLDAAFALLGPTRIGLEALVANGLAALLIGGPLWWYAWRNVQASLEFSKERHSMFRLVFLYLVVFTGVGGVLGLSGNALSEALNGLLQSSFGFSEWMGRVSGELAGAIFFASLWYFYARVLRADLGSVPSTPRRDGLQRLYRYVLAFAGLVAVFTGLMSISNYLIDELSLATPRTFVYGARRLASGLSALLIGLPLWLRSWLTVSAQSARADESGDHARRSVVRRGYLYLAVFIGVLGVMFTTGSLIFEILRSLFGDSGLDIGQSLADDILFAGLLFYHWRVMQADNRRKASSLAEKQGLFPALVLDAGDEAFSNAIMAAIREEAPEVPVAVHFPSGGAPGEDLLEAGAVVMPSTIASNPPESLRIWLNAFKGSKVIVPVSQNSWYWVDTSGKPLNKLAKQAAEVVRDLAEGGDVRTGSRISPWIIVAAIFGGLIALMIVTSLLVEVLL